MYIKVFFGHVQPGFSHAFAASRVPEKEDEWYLLDSLLPDPCKINSTEELIENTQFAGRASVMIVPDGTRPVTELHSILLDG